ncbi:MAG: hypothetical protein QOG42_1419, partial [Solirubrobacteraceae bacterium]|nr:hypothetical protein [Solirubrobacteraceae bacterium]
ALGAVDQELRALERALDDRRPLHELHEPGIAACARCGALHASEANFCSHCGLELSGPRAMGEIGGSIAAPPQAPPSPEQLVWQIPIPPPVDQPTAPTVVTAPVDSDQPTVAYVPALAFDDGPPAAADSAGGADGADGAGPSAPAAPSAAEGYPDEDGAPAPGEFDDPLADDELDEDLDDDDLLDDEDDDELAADPAPAQANAKPPAKATARTPPHTSGGS